MKKILLTLMASLLLGLGYSQNMYSVNNNNSFSADFDDLQTAINTVEEGSILIVQGSGVSYGAITVTKPLVILGPGYHLTNQPNPITQADHLQAQTSTFTMETTASGSIVSGMLFNGAVNFNECHNTLLEGNKHLNTINSNSSANVTISKSFFANCRISASNSQGMKVSNNIFHITIGGDFITVYHYNGPMSSVIAENNTFLRYNNSAPYNYFSATSDSGIVGGASLTLRNNIIANLEAPEIGFNTTVGWYGIITMENNVLSCGSFSNTAGVVNNVSPESLFLHLGSTVYDIDYIVQNAAGSPAIGAGTNGSTCGAYGGDDIYSPSGLNLIPNIYDIHIPIVGSTTGGIDIQIKARANE